MPQGTQCDSTSDTQAKRLRDLEGHRVTVSVADGTLVADVLLVSAGRGTVASVWLDVGGMDVFLHRSQILDAWETITGRAA